MPKVTKREKITQSFVNNLKLPKNGEQFVWDSEVKGFGIKLTPTSMTYIVQGRVGGKTKRLAIGKHGIFTPSRAREESKDKLREMALGIDPVQERRKSKAMSQTLAQIAEIYKVQKRTREGHPLKENTKIDIDRHLNETFRDWKDRPLSTLTREQVKRKYIEAAKSSVARANQGFRILRAIFNWARANSKTDADGEPALGNNPVQVLTDLQMWGFVPTRKGKIPTDKIGAAWNFIQERRINPALHSLSLTSTDLVLFLLLTGCRSIEEGAKLKWTDINLLDGVMHLPDPKNRNPVTIPLSTQALDMLRDRPKDKAFVFPGSSKAGHISDIRATMHILSKEIKEEPDIRPHDLRRTFRAVAIEAGVELWRTKLLMNHKLSGDVTISSYTETSDLRYLRADTQKISDWIEKQGVKAAHKVVDLKQARVA
jgi:integrase